MQTTSNRPWSGFWSSSSVAMILAWLYFAAFALYQLISVWGLDARTWDLSSRLFMGMFFVPVAIIPFFLLRAWRRKRHLQLAKILPWAFRVMYISIIFALCDCWWATTEGAPFLATLQQGTVTLYYMKDLVILWPMRGETDTMDRKCGFGLHPLELILAARLSTSAGFGVTTPKSEFAMRSELVCNAAPPLRRQKMV